MEFKVRLNVMVRHITGFSLLCLNCERFWRFFNDTFLIQVVIEPLLHSQLMVAEFWLMSTIRIKHKGIFSDSNIIISDIYIHVDINKQLISNISVVSKFTYISYAWLCVFHCSIDYCVELIIIYENLCQKSSHFKPKWFLLNSFGKMCFLKESYKQMHKFQVLTNLRASSKVWNHWVHL